MEPAEETCVKDQLILIWGDIVKKLLLALSLVLLLTPAALESDNPLEALTIGGVEFTTQGEWSGPYRGVRLTCQYRPDSFVLELTDGAWIAAEPDSQYASFWINRMSSWVESQANIYVIFSDNYVVDGIKVEPPTN